MLRSGFPPVTKRSGKPSAQPLHSADDSVAKGH